MQLSGDETNPDQPAATPLPQRCAEEEEGVKDFLNELESFTIGTTQFGELLRRFAADSKASHSKVVEKTEHDSIELQPVDLAGATLGNLRIEHKLGAGGMGEVWRGIDMDLDLPVAVKVLPPKLAADSRFVMRFMREARAIALLDHPNIVRVLQAGRREHNDRTLRIIVMELVEGQDAHDLMRASENGKLDPQDAAAVVLGAARALRYAHAKHVIHRDIKPSNILVLAGDPSLDTSDGVPLSVKVLDFGLARVLEGRSGLPDDEGEQQGHILGTPQFMAPEQGLGKPVDARADTYSLGITLYELLTGELPFDGGTSYSVIDQHANEPLPMPERLFENVPAELRDLLEEMCAKSVEDRPDMVEVIELLEEFLGVPRLSSASDSKEKSHHNIHAPTNTFVGRERELAELGAILSEGSRIVTVLGPAGVGKTRFVQEFGVRITAPRMRKRVSAASSQLGRSSRTASSVNMKVPGGVWFCDLTEARTEFGIAQAVGKGLGIPLTQADPIAQIHAALRLRPGTYD